MQEENPLNPIIEQLNDLLKKCEGDFTGKSLTTIEHKNLRKQISQLAANIDVFKEVTDSVLEESAAEVVGKKKVLPNETPQENSEILKQLQVLEQNILQKKSDLSVVLHRAKKNENDQKRKEIGRKKKFRGLNPRGKWQKL